MRNNKRAVRRYNEPLIYRFVKYLSERFLYILLILAIFFFIFLALTDPSAIIAP